MRTIIIMHILFGVCVSIALAALSAGYKVNRRSFVYSVLSCYVIMWAMYGMGRIAEQ